MKGAVTEFLGFWNESGSFGIFIIWIIWKLGSLDETKECKFFFLVFSIEIIGNSPRHGLSRKVSLVENALDSGVKIRLPFNSTSSHLFLSARELPHSELQVNTQFQAEDVIVITDVSVSGQL